MAIGFVLCIVKQVVSASTTVCLLVKSCLVMFRFKLQECKVELQKMMLFQLNAVNAQKQSGAKDCGVFALANVFHLANGDKVCRIN